MSKFSFSDIKNFSASRTGNKVIKAFNRNSNAINMAFRIGRTGLELYKCKTPMEVAKTIANTVERITSSAEGNVLGQEHREFIDGQGMIPFSLSLDDWFYQDIIAALPQEQVGKGYYAYVIYYVNDMPIVFSPDEHVRKAGVDGNEKTLLAKPEHIPAIQEYLNNKLIDQYDQHLGFSFDSNNGIRGRSSTGLHNKKFNHAVVLQDNPYFDKIKKAFDAGINRSYMFYGPPGAGKTTIVVDLIKKLGVRTFSINFIDNVDINQIKEIIETFKIDAIIIDDIDHQSNLTAKALEFVEYCKSQVKLVLVTANIINALNPALIRPGRVDEIIHVSSLSEKVVKEIIGSNQQIFDKVKDLPVAYINEIVTRIKLNGVENIDEDIQEMVDRSNKYLKTLE